MFDLGRRLAPLVLVAVAANCAPPHDNPAPASATAAVAPRGFVIRGAVVFDGEKRTSGDVWVSGATILAVGARPEGEPEAAYAVIDGKGKTLLPGLVDAHVHAGNDEDNLAQALAFGVTTEPIHLRKPCRSGHSLGYLLHRPEGRPAGHRRLTRPNWHLLQKLSAVFLPSIGKCSGLQPGPMNAANPTKLHGTMRCPFWARRQASQKSRSSKARRDTHQTQLLTSKRPVPYRVPFPPGR